MRNATNQIQRARKMRREMTSAERKLWMGLRAHRLDALHFRRQAPCGYYIADFLCQAARLVVEVDGATHSSEQELMRDARRDAWFAVRGFAVLRVSNDEVYHEFEAVMETIWMRARERLPPPHPSPALREREQTRAVTMAPPFGERLLEGDHVRLRPNEGGEDV
jgi:very-short-patch-repair endonuclease